MHIHVDSTSNIMTNNCYYMRIYTYVYNNVCLTATVFVRVFKPRVEKTRVGKMNVTYCT